MSRMSLTRICGAPTVRRCAFAKGATGTTSPPRSPASRSCATSATKTFANEMNRADRKSRGRHMFSLACVGFAATAICLFGVEAAWADEPAAKTPSPEQVRKAAERGLAFLEKDAAKWREERKCATCHHGTMTVWALSE